MSSLKVAVRVRPFNTREIDMDAQLIVQMDSKKTRLLKPKLQSIRDVGRDNHHDFTFDYSYWSFDEHDSHFATQEEVYNDLGTDVIDCAYEGYNACVFAYGQTGSGKTFTMMGAPDNPGLIPRICQELFARMRVGQESGTGYKTHASYLEIYNERVKDLLGPHSAGHGLRVREHRTLGPYVENLSQHAVSNFEEIQECIARGNIQRTTASTNMNDTSSRSHAIFTITFVQAVFMNDMPSETVSKIHLVDLAGSERANATGATGQRLKEGAHINKSLVTLGSVISALAEQTNTNFATLASSPTGTTKRILYIPYRDSILTWLLKDSLGGNSKTIMIAALSPADCNYSETLSTLRYANRAKNIINKPTINEDTNVKLIRELREEINKLKSMLNGDINTLQPSLKVLEDLQKKEAQEKVLTEEWTEKWKEAQSILQEQKSLGLRKSGLGVVLDSEMPHLIGIHNDVTTGVTLYSLKEGETLIGTENSDTPQDIELVGDGIRPQHCRIVLQEGIVTLHPHPGAQCWLNAHLIDEPTHISQGDIILLGRTNIFRFNNPAEAAKLRKDLSRSQLDMSRLSLITSSRENLLTSSFYSEEDSMSGSMTASPLKRPERQYYPTKPMSRDDPELQDENRKILETIENALKQLNIERVQMHDQYKAKVRKLTDELKRLEIEEMDKLDILRCQEQELLARRDMLLWEKNNEKVQIDIVCRQISAFQTQLDSKKRDFSEYVAKELQEMQDCGKLDEIGIKIEEFTPLSDQLLLQVADSLDLFASQFIKDTVKRNNDEIRKLDEKIMEKECILNASTKRIAQVDEQILQIQQQLEKLQEERQESEASSEFLRQKKLGLNLNLAKTTSTNTDDSTYHTAQSNISLSSPTIVDDQISPLSTLSATSADLDDTSTTERGVSSSISLKSSPSESCEVANNNLIPTPAAASKAIMSDSGVYLDPVRTTQQVANCNGLSTSKGKDNNNRLAEGLENTAIGSASGNSGSNGTGMRTSDEDSASCSSCETGRKTDVPRPYCSMHALRRNIANQKALIMKNLEMNVSKAQLDEQIVELQELQRRLIAMEKELLDSPDDCIAERDECSTYYRGENDINYELSPNDCMDESAYMPSMTRSCPSMRDFPESEHFITIPSFVIRGAGKQTHYEYEVRITLPDGKLNILRRYSRFRELHLSMKHCYGAKISALPFPRREIFSSNSESVAKHRRRLLELYLRRLFVVCTKIPQCPIYEGPGGPGLTRATLSQLSPFFKKGLFENGKHGTG
ncbi:PREDICTED: kinesin-like protein Klp98A isoform X2 [Rhagoletis zephyria]|uniref:kinesin-like protein Klp98A isoform X2 n=1 Tax=Rhagoletis zephyria TaxID=28612 RepID=UPI0008117476|nr:PREDICTED: kinesin-like protein Klp98A isoform X2 [Rhagoletis zephyria]